MADARSKVYCVDVRGSALVFGANNNTFTRLESSVAEDENSLSFVKPKDRQSTFDCGSAVYCLQGSTDDAHHVLAGCADGTVQLWTTRSGKRLFTPVRHQKWVFGLQFDAEKVISASYDGVILNYDLLGHAVATQLYHPKGAAYVLLVSSFTFYSLVNRCVSFEGDLLLTGGADNAVRGWDLRTGTPAFRIREHTNVVWNVQRYQNMMISSGFDGLVNVCWYSPFPRDA